MDEYISSRVLRGTYFGNIEFPETVAFYMIMRKELNPKRDYSNCRYSATFSISPDGIELVINPRRFYNFIKNYHPQKNQLPESSREFCQYLSPQTKSAIMECTFEVWPNYWNCFILRCASIIKYQIRTDDFAKFDTDLLLDNFDAITSEFPNAIQCKESGFYIIKLDVIAGLYSKYLYAGLDRKVKVLDTKMRKYIEKNGCITKYLGDIENVIRDTMTKIAETGNLVITQSFHRFLRTTIWHKKINDKEFWNTFIKYICDEPLHDIINTIYI